MRARFKSVPCKGCGKPIVWAQTADGRSIPLDARRYWKCVYEVMPQPNGEYPCRRIETAMVTHVATCSAANKFSGKNRK